MLTSIYASPSEQTKGVFPADAGMNRAMPSIIAMPNSCSPRARG